jgi:NAD-dependent SIR2 family protein deacetylase
VSAWLINLFFRATSCSLVSTSAEVNPRARIVPKPLRANVLIHGPTDPNVQWETVVAEAEGVDTLLVAGASLAELEVFSLVDMLSKAVHQNHGRVVFINNGNLLTTRLAHLIDFYIEADVQECARMLLELLRTVGVSSRPSGSVTRLPRIHRQAQSRRKIYGRR